ncbi:MAG: condensation domain-containing protein [Methylococcales bacterium]
MSGVSNRQESSKASSAFWQSIRTNLDMQHRAAPIHPVPRDGHLPLSFAQERVWFVEQCQPGTTVHNLRAVFHLGGALDAAILEKSVQEIVRRHEILRTTFPAVDGQPVQAISPEVDLRLAVVDLGNLPSQQRDAEVRRLASVQLQQPFDLSQGPLMRLTLVRLAAQEHILLRAIHHIINDRWSDSVFLRELAVLYPALRAGEPSPLPDLPIQYADIAYFQRQWLQGEVLASRLGYWRRQLNGCPPVIDLPIDHPASRSRGPACTGRGQFLALPGNLSEALKSLAYQEGVSLFVVLLAAFKTLLYQYSGQEDLVVCSPVAGRNRVATRKLIGYFNHLVLLRSSVHENPSLREIVRRVSRATLGALEHQDLPLQQVAEALNLPDALLSRVLFALQNVPSQPLTLADISLCTLDLDEGIANFDLFLSIRQREGELTCVLRYKTDLFEASTIADLLERYRLLLNEVAAHPDRLLGELPRYAQAPPCDPLGKPEEARDIAPRNEIEQRIAAVWRETLHIEEIGIHSNFFDLGGRSLAMVQVCGKLQAVFHREFSVRELFQTPTIHGMARYLSREGSGEAEAPRPAETRIQRQQSAMKRQKQLMQRQRRNG